MEIQGNCDHKHSDFVALTRQAPPQKFIDPDCTAKGQRRASVALSRLETLWFNTGTLCNLTCRGCYIESSPRNDRLVYLARAEVRMFLDEARGGHPALTEIGITGGEPFMNPEIMEIVEDSLAAGYRVLVLTNAMTPMRRHEPALLDLQRRYGRALSLRVSMDHYTAARHEVYRGPRSWALTLAGLHWLSRNGFEPAVAARMLWDEDETAMRAGFAGLFRDEQIDLDADDRHRLVLFPEMDEKTDVPEISEHCWSILGKSPDDVMCARSRMVVKRKGDNTPLVVSCTLLPYDDRFAMGRTLAQASRAVKLNHPHCAKFCVLGGASCSG